jgi:hypothetical protein
VPVLTDLGLLKKNDKGLQRSLSTPNVNIDIDFKNNTLNESFLQNIAKYTQQPDSNVALGNQKPDCHLSNQSVEILNLSMLSEISNFDSILDGSSSSSNINNRSNEINKKLTENDANTKTNDINASNGKIFSL